LTTLSVTPQVSVPIPQRRTPFFRSVCDGTLASQTIRHFGARASASLVIRFARYSLALLSSATELIPVARAPASDKKADQRSDSDSDSDGFIRMLMHGFVGSFSIFGCFVADSTRDFSRVFQSGGETLPRFGDFFPSHVRRGGNEGLRVFCKPVDCMIFYVFMLFHIFLLV
jgi:hypothetical protein